MWFFGNIKDELIPEAGRNLGCPKCKHRFFVDKLVLRTCPNPSCMNVENTKDKNCSKCGTLFVEFEEPETDDGDETAIDDRRKPTNGLAPMDCPNCGGSLEFTDRSDIYCCSHCKSNIRRVDSTAEKGDQNKVKHLSRLAESASRSKNWPEAYKY